MQSKPKQTRRKRKWTEIDHDQPASKRQKTSHKTSPNAMNIDAMKQELFNKYHTKFPWTFFKFWQFIQSITRKNENPLHIFKCLNLQLVGPFEYIHGDLKALSDSQILVHYRYHYDLPEFQSIIIETDSTDHIHYGFWRDDPNYNPIGICKTDGKTAVLDKATSMIHQMASNLFFFIKDRIANMEEHKNTDTQRMKEIQTSLEAFANVHKIKLNEKNQMDVFKQRAKRTVAKTFSGFGLIVPMEGDIGYRSIGYSLSELKKIFKRMNRDKQKKNKVDASEMEIILTNICLADDEGDPGMGYELGIDFFYSYAMFEKHSKRLLTNAYNLTNRNGFKKILDAHLEVRRKRNGEYNELLNVNSNKKKDGKQKITKFFAKKESKKKVIKTLDELSSDSDDA